MRPKTTKDPIDRLAKETALYTRNLITRSVFAMILTGSALGTAYSAQPYLDDANPTTSSVSGTGLPSLSQHGFPRIHVLEVNKDISGDMLSKYQFIDAHGSGFDQIRNALNYSPQTMVLRHISGRAYQGYAYKDCHITGGIGFESTGPVSQGGPSTKGCAIYAGHWLYRAGSPLTTAINASATTLHVLAASRFDVGQYVVIHDAPAGSFNNAEHAKVTARNLSTNTLTLQSRGFKSTPRSHGAGAIVAQHTLGQGSSPELWAWNMSTKSPKDGAGKTFAQFYADWLGANLSKYKGGADSGINVAGILFDADMYFELAPAQADSNNDLVRDDGMAADGTNWLGDGLEQFYAMVRSRLPNKYIMTGMHEARGFTTTNGTQMENWLDYGSGDFNGDPKYDQLNSVFSIYLFNMGESRDILLVHNLSKTPTNRYPGNENPPPPNNRPARLGLAMTLMDDGYYGDNTLYTADPWWDEYAVNVTPGSSTYGEAINMHSAGAVRDHRGWLGKPTGEFRRIYNDADFAISKSKLSNGTFESSLSGWTGTRVGLSRITSAFDGTGALRAGEVNPFTSVLTGAQIKSPNVSLQSGKQYTIAFAARASKTRLIKASFGSWGERFMVGPKWRRYVMSFQQGASQNVPLLISVGREKSQVDIDSVYVFEGNVNVFRRDFEHGIALTNATPASRTIDLGGTFQRIKGTVDPSVNNGATVTSVTLPPYDGLILVRPAGSSSSPPPPTTEPPSTGSASIGDFVWTDADRDGVRDWREGGRGGVRVELLGCQSNNVVQSTTTSSSGVYHFENLAGDSYRVRWIAPSGMTFSPRLQGSSRGKDSNADPANGMSTCLPMTSTQVRNGIDAGLMP